MGYHLVHWSTTYTTGLPLSPLVYHLTTGLPPTSLGYHLHPGLPPTPWATIYTTGLLQPPLGNFLKLCLYLYCMNILFDIYWYICRNMYCWTVIIWAIKRNCGFDMNYICSVCNKRVDMMRYTTYIFTQKEHCIVDICFFGSACVNVPVTPIKYILQGAK